MGQLTDRRWWEAAGTRAIRTTAQTAFSLIGTNAIGMTDVDWPAVASAAALAAVLSLLMSIASLPEAEGGEACEGRHARGE